MPTHFYGQSSYSPCQKASKLIHLLKLYHIEPKELDDTFSLDMHHNFFVKLDPQRLFLSKPAIDNYGHLKYQWDDIIRKEDCRSLDSLTKYFEQGLLVIQDELKGLGTREISFERTDSIQLTLGIVGQWAKDEEERRNKWIKWIKYLTLNEHFSRDSSTLGGLPGLLSLFEKIRDKQVQNIGRILNDGGGVKEYVGDRFLNALSTCFDPHTMYLPNADMKRFLESNAPEVPSFGIDLEEDINGNVKIARLVPGGSAWRSNELHEGDILLSVRGQNELEYDLLYHNAREVWEIFEQVGSNMELSVRKVGGQEVSVKLGKEILRADANIIKSVVLTKQDGFKVAYISLPGFYSANGTGQGGCSDDLAKEIVKLRKEGIEGMILDVRDNGGGDMYEAIQLAGIFIDRGSLGIYEEKNGQAATLKDPYIGTVYEGPLLVMVNGGSASASELLAGTLQDHNRALVVGSPTFGKASGQRIVPLYDNLEDSDFLKITELKLYLPTGRSYQLSGIQPGIRLPRLPGTYQYNEGDLPFALTPNKSNKKAYYYPLKPIDIDTLAVLSNQRIAGNSYFQYIREIKEHFLQYQNNPFLTIPISHDSFYEFISIDHSISQLDAPHEPSRIDISFNSFDDQVITIDGYARDVLNDLENSIKEDRYVDECYNIMVDYIRLEAE